MGYVYLVINNINGKKYIGKTETSVEKRWKEHIRASKRKKLEMRPLYRAIRKYGVENFSIKEIDTGQGEELSDKEQYWIQYYNTYKDGYNATIGGDGRPFLDYNLIYNTYLKTQSAIETGYLCNCHPKSVLNIVSSINPTLDKTLLRNGKKVAQIDKKTGKIINTFPSCREAGRMIGKSDQHIQEVCSGKRKSAYGYLWRYI